MKTLISKLLSALAPSQEEILRQKRAADERYLSQATSLQELETLQRNLDRQSAQQGAFWGYKL